MADSRRPNLVVIAGPNGSGKTTLTRRLRHHTWLHDSRYINADDIARELFGDWNAPGAVLNAAIEAERQREQCFAKSQSFAFETVFSTDRNFKLLMRAVKAGYFTRLFFVGTADPAINIRRVASRVSMGGHDVPEDRIVARYHRSMNNLVHGLSIVDRGYVFDNSEEDKEPKLILRTQNGRLAKIYGDLPPWRNDVLGTLDLEPWPDSDDIKP